jgi:hypothetical protein
VPAHHHNNKDHTTMPMELYSSEAFVRDIVNAISESEGKPRNIGGNHHAGIDRGYAFQLISDAKKSVEGNAGSSEISAAGNAAATRTTAIKKFMTKLSRQSAAPKKSRTRAVKKPPASGARSAAKTPRLVVARRMTPEAAR